jgi:hypothetical protein
MKHWKYFLIYLLGWAFRILGTLLLSTCRVSVFGSAIEETYFEENPARSLLYASWHRGVFFGVYFYRGQNVLDGRWSEGLPRDAAGGRYGRC